MAVRHTATSSRAVRPPRAVVWVLLVASATAILFVGGLATTLLLGRVGAWPPAEANFWLRLLAACALTLVSLSLRAVRWIFLLRRSETRIPIRDAYIGYFAGLSLLFAPVLLGEIAVRAWILKRRGGVPLATTAVVNIWERVLDLIALGVVSAAAGLINGHRDSSIWQAIAAGAVMLMPPVRRVVLTAVVIVARWGARWFAAPEPSSFERLETTRCWLPAFAASMVVWLLPGMGLWLLSGGWGDAVSLVAAEQVYSRAATLGATLLVPGGVLIAGPGMLAMLGAHGVPAPAATLIVFGVRLATVGVSVAFGVIFVIVHLRSLPAASATHFDDIADAYDVQIPESRRLSLLERKTGLMREVLAAQGIGGRGLDVGCGQGAYVARMRTLGFEVSGIDASSGQVRLAAEKIGSGDLVCVGSALNIPASDDSYDFLYVINVLHHLGSTEEQRRAFNELMRVLKPGGLLFVHEINTRNALFRFYMGYVFPSLNCIDEGVERWLLPQQLGQYTDAPVADVRYFTFLPDFVPQPIARLLGPLERWLESSSLRVYSAHYMAVLKNHRPAAS
jgi:ubiquinone/menaquinone biosynthesis C-methylase UbiE/uncharacterized membrane protein YbhN (UPF0104 family)